MGALLYLGFAMPKSRFFYPQGIGFAAGFAMLTYASATMAQSTTAQPTTAPATAVPGASGLSTDDMFQVDQRNPVGNTTGAFFNGLPLPSLGYTLRVTVLSTYDSNLLRLSNGQPAPPGSSKSDFRLTPIVAGSVNMPVGRQSLYANASFGRDFYLHNKDYDRQRILLGGGANLAAGSSCTANISANWVQQQANPNATVVNTPNTQTTTGYGASATCGGISGFTPSISYRHGSSTNAGTGRAVNDLNSNAYSISIGYARPTLGVVSVFGSRNSNRYPNQTVVIGTESFTRGANITNLGVQYQRDIGTRLRANASLSYVDIVPTLSIQPKQSGLGYGLSVDYNPTARYSFTVNGSRNASSSPNSNSVYFIQQAFGATFNYRLRSNLSASLLAGTSLRNYKGTIGPDQLQSDRLNRLRASLNWQPISHMSTSIFVAQINRNANPVTYSYNDTTAGISISYGIQ